MYDLAWELQNYKHCNTTPEVYKIIWTKKDKDNGCNIDLHCRQRKEYADWMYQEVAVKYGQKSPHNKYK